MAIANDIRVGNILNYRNGLWKVLKTDHVKPGKGGAFVQVEMKELKHGTKANERLRSDESVDIAHYESKDMQYLYSSGDVITLMDNKNFEQLEINKSYFDGQEIFLKDGMEVTCEYAQDTLIAAYVPTHVTLEVVEAEAVVKGQTASGSNKPAKLENGIRVMVPQFITVGDNVIVDTREQTYVKRAE
jgi:elongation factor P